MACFVSIVLICSFKVSPTNTIILMAFLFIIVDLIVFAGVSARWCYRAARRMLPQAAAPPTNSMIYAVADKSFDVTAAMISFYATESAPTIDQARVYLRQYAHIDAKTLTLYLTHRARVHAVAIDMQKRSVVWGGSIAFGSMLIEDLIEYSVRVDLKTMSLIETSSGERMKDDSEEIPDLPNDIDAQLAYVTPDSDDYEEDSAVKKFIMQAQAQHADLHANQQNINIRASSFVEE